MKITNTTKLDNKTIREIIRMVRPPGISNFDVMIKNSSKNTCRGRAYLTQCSYHYSNNQFVVIGIPKNEKNYPYNTYGGKGYISTRILTKMEDIVYVIAHELRHLWQSKVKKGRRVWGARGQYSERDADAYAIKKLREYRRQKK